MSNFALFKKSMVFCGLIMAASLAFALGTSGVTYQGRILKPDGSPLSGSSVQFKLQLRAPDANNCLMYEELQQLDMHASNGAFSLTMNDGTGARLDSSGYGLDRIFANRGTFTFSAATCSSGSTYTPGDGDGRNFVVLFKDETMSSWEPIPAQKINFVPLAFEAKQVQGFTADSLLRVVGASGDPLTGLAPLSNAQYTELMALVNGTSSAFTKLGGVPLPTMTSGEVLGWNGSAWVSQPAVAGPNSVSSSMIQAGAVDSTKIASGAVGTSQMASNVSIATSGTVATAVSTTRDFKIYATSPSTFYVGMLAPALSSSYTLTWPMDAGSNGQVLTSNGAGVLSWTTPATGTGDFFKNGSVAMTGAFKAANGSMAAPSLTFASDTNTGFYTAGTNDGSFEMTLDGIHAMSFNVGQITSYAPITASNGSVTNPEYALNGFGGSGTGLFAPATNTAALATNGVERMRLTPAGLVGIGTTAPATALDVAGAVRVGSATTCGSPTAGSIRYSAGNLDYCDGSSWKTLGVAGSGLTALTGDVTASGTGSVAATVASVGGVTAANVASGANLANAATSANSPLKIVKRDASGNVSLNDVTLSTVNALSLQLRDGGGNFINFYSPATLGSTYNLTFPTDHPLSNGQVLTGDTSGTLTWTTPSTAPTGAAGGDLSGTYPNPTVATIGGSTAALVHSAELAANAAASANTFGALVKRDGAGSFSATDLTTSSVKADTLKLNNAGSVMNIVNPIGGAWTMTLPATAGSNGQFLTTDGLGALSWSTIASSPWTTQAPGINYMAGNVGIGTTSPAVKLDVFEQTTSTAFAAIYSSRFIETANPTSTSSSYISGSYSKAEVATGNAQNFTSGLFASTNQSYHRGTGTVAQAAGADAEVYNNSTGTITEADGVQAAVTNKTGTIAGAYGVASAIINSNSGTITNGAAFYAKAPTRSAGHLYNAYGLYIETPTAGETTNYSIYSAGGTNYLGGSVGIGTTSPKQVLDVNGAVRVGTTASMVAGSIRWTGTNFQGTDGVSWFNIMPNPPAAGGCDQTQTFNTPGTYGYTVPSSYATITVKVWGGGGAGGYYFGNGSQGGGSSTVSSLGLTGGGGGPGSRDSTGSMASAGLGGAGSGGSINLNGDNGTKGTYATLSGSGGSAPSGGGGGGAGVGQGGFRNPGGVPGGGGGGGSPDGSSQNAGGGGAGGYTEKTYTPATLPPGASINDIVVGAGGVPGYLAHPNEGGYGGNGQVSVTCSTTGTPASVGWGSCTIAAFAATSGINSKACAGVATGSPISCSPAAAAGSPTVTWSARASAADTVDISLSANFTTSTSWKCMFMN